MDTKLFGAAGCRLYLETWLANTDGLNAEDHCKWKPTVPEMRAYRAARDLADNVTA